MKPSGWTALGQSSSTRSHISGSHLRLATAIESSTSPPRRRRGATGSGSTRPGRGCAGRCTTRARRAARRRSPRTPSPRIAAARRRRGRRRRQQRPTDVHPAGSPPGPAAAEDVLHDGLGREPLRLGAAVQDQTMRQDGGRQGDDVVGHDEVATVDRRRRLSGVQSCSAARGLAPSVVVSLSRVALTRSTMYASRSGLTWTRRASAAAAVISAASATGTTSPCGSAARKRCRTVSPLRRSDSPCAGEAGSGRAEPREAGTCP